MRGVAGVSHPGIRAFRRRCYVEQNIRKSKKRGNGVSHPGGVLSRFFTFALLPPPAGRPARTEELRNVRRI